MKATLRHIYLCRTANMSWRTCVVIKQIQSNQSNWRRRYWQPSHLPDHESPLGTERQKHLCPLLLGAKPLWHRRESESPLAMTKIHWRLSTLQIWCHWSTLTFNRRSKLSWMYLYMVEICISWNQQTDHPKDFGTWPEIPTPDKSWRSCNNPTSNWPPQSHKVPYLVPRTTNNLPALWPDSDPRTHAPGMYSVTTQSWWILHCWPTRDPLWGSPRGLHSWVSEISWIILSNMNGHIPRRTPNLNWPPDDKTLNPN